MRLAGVCFPLSVLFVFFFLLITAALPSVFDCFLLEDLLHLRQRASCRENICIGDTGKGFSFSMLYLQLIQLMHAFSVDFDFP